MNTGDFARYVQEIVDTGIFTNDGPFVKLLEEKVAAYACVKHVIAVSNATVGIEWTLRAMNLKPGGQVILPSFTFIATAHAVIAAGLTPVFCDVNMVTHLIEVDEIAKLITKETVAILGVNLWGLMCTPTVEAYANEKNIPIIFDSAHSFGACNSHGARAGNTGCAEIFSLHATKLFNSFEGGLILTNDDALAFKLVAMRNFGITGQDKVEFIGTNCKMSEIHAAFALSQFASIDETVAIYRRNALRYSEELKTYNLKSISLWNDNFFGTACTHSYVCLVVEDSSPITRDALMEGLREKNIYAKRYFYPGTHKHECYAQWTPVESLKNTEWLNEHLLILPTGRMVTSEDIDRIVESIADIYNTAARFTTRAKPDATIKVDQTKSATRKAYITQKIQTLRVYLEEYEAELRSIAHE